MSGLRHIHVSSSTTPPKLPHLGNGSVFGEKRQKSANNNSGNCLSLWDYLQGSLLNKQVKHLPLISLLHFGLIEIRCYYSEDPKDKNPLFMDLGPLEPRIYSFQYTKVPQNKQENIEACQNKFIFDNLRNYEIHFLALSKRRAPKNDEDPSKNFVKILNMGPIYT